ncbi:zeta toxin family protein [Microbacterium rhizosphaerae]|uniref:UDP-N-acetylglucosamine kinase n=1 Tax=Microbacterium rhizosphaerae TaxID=1678237 RepID=A0ABZ0SM83_9MICO|nr:zeta toxin family protein [Microbacterium rhizosphaerae]WPR89728.1 zeta toxin family protein [Microbacterium rhizosphaerae]
MADDIFENEVRPFLFDGVAEGQQRPEFVLLVGQAGAGRSRAVGRLLEELPGRAVVLRAADLTPFLHDTQGPDVIRTWISASLTYAREHRTSIILEDSFRSVDDANAALNFFERAGFQNRVVAIAVPRAESLLATAARIARGGAAMRPSQVSLRAENDAEISTAGQIVSSAPAGTLVSVIARDGTVSPPVAVAEAASNWRDAYRTPLPARVSAEWISELRRLTESVLDLPPRSRTHLTEALIDLHRVALSEVIPSLPLAGNSPARNQLTVRIRRDLAVLESHTPTLESTPVLPEVAPESQDGLFGP